MIGSDEVPQLPDARALDLATVGAVLRQCAQVVSRERGDADRRTVEFKTQCRNLDTAVTQSHAAMAGVEGYILIQQKHFHVFRAVAKKLQADLGVAPGGSAKYRSDQMPTESRQLRHPAHRAPPPT